jgi:hypothetical protein
MLFSKGHVTSSNGGCLSLFSCPEDATVGLRPKLSITYSGPTSIAKIEGVLQNRVVISEMLHNGIRVLSGNSFTAAITVYAMNGSIMQRIENRHIVSGTTAVSFAKSLKAGVYIVKVDGAGVSVLRKISMR